MQKIVILISFMVCGYFSAAAQGSIIKGSIYDKTSKGPVVEAYIYLDTVSNGEASDQKGFYEFKNVPQGIHTVYVKYIGYISQQKIMHVSPNSIVKINFYLDEKTEEISAVNVFGKLDATSEVSSRIAEKNAGNITNIISATAIERSPDINAANVLKRLSGITLEGNGSSDESYAIIRGMGPRYNNVLINGMQIPSPDEKLRSVPLNIIPSNLLQKITVSKTLMPSMEGDAIGGTIDLSMRNAPDSFSISANASIGYSQVFFHRRFIYFPTKDIQEESPLQRNPPGYAAQPGDFSRSNLDFRTKQALPNGTLGLTFSDRFFNKKAGIVIADNMQNLYLGDKSQFAAVSLGNEFISDQLRPIEISNNVSSTHELNNGLIAHIDYELNDKNQFNINNFFLYTYLGQARLSTDTTLVGTGRTGSGTGQVFLNDRSLTQYQYIENVEISGRHLLLNDHLSLDWSGVWSEAGKHSPDRATLTNDFLINPDYSKTPTYFNSIERIWQKNNDHDYTGRMNLSYRGKAGRKSSIELKAGGMFRSKSRYNLQDLYTLRPPATNSNGSNTSGKPVFTDIYHTQWSVFNSAGSGTYDPDNYRATEQVGAAYLQGRWGISNVEISGGVRVEKTSQHFKTSKQSVTALSEEYINYLDVLPSIHFKYKLNQKTNLRLSYFKSISRPNYYELVPYTIRGLDYIESGNPNLKHAVANNFDFRYEVYPGGEQQLFAGVFYKVIQNPIELGLVNQGLNSGQVYYTPENYGTAYNYGLELAFIKYFGKIGFEGNYTYTHSAITAPKILYYKANHDNYLKQIDSLHVNETRPLQGQSDNVVNLSLLYKNTAARFYAQLSYQYIGRTLSQVSIYYNSDYYQQPVSYLSLSLQKELGDHFTIQGKFNNLLNSSTTVKAQGSLVVAKYTYGPSYQLNLKYTF